MRPSVRAITRDLVDPARGGERNSVKGLPAGYVIGWPMDCSKESASVVPRGSGPVFALSYSIGSQNQYLPRLVLSKKLPLGLTSLGAVLLIHETIVRAKESTSGCSR